MAKWPFKFPKQFTAGYSTSQKPTVPVEIDKSNPLADGLTGCWLFNGTINLVDSEFANGLIGDANLDRNTLNLDGTGDFLDISRKRYSVNDITILTKVTPNSVTGTRQLVCSDNYGSSRRKFQFRLSDNKAQFIPFNTSGNNGSIIGTTALSAGSTYNLGATYKNGGSNNYKVWVNGKEDATGTLSGGLKDTDSLMTFGCFSNEVDSSISTSSYFEGEIEYVYIFDRALSESELRSITANPYQILKPQVETFYFPATAGSGGTVTGTGTPTATTATSSASGTVTASITGTATTTANNATTSASGTVSGNITGTSTASATTATASGTGLRLIAGTASTSQNNATTTGTGSVGGNISGSASPQATTATANGTGLRLITGNSTSQAETATASGLGVVGNAVIGSGSPQAETATSTGTGLRLIQGSATTQAETATSTGTGSNAGVITGTASPQAEIAGVTATGVILTTITGTASVQATTATASGTDADSTIVHPRRIYTVETENRVYTVEAEDRVYVA